MSQRKIDFLYKLGALLEEHEAEIEFEQEDLGYPYGIQKTLIIHLGNERIEIEGSTLNDYDVEAIINRIA